MKRIIAISAVLVCLGSTGALAEEPSGIWRNTVLRETAIRNSLWLESSSAAGLAFSPYKVFNVLDLSYDGGYGEFRKNGTGKSSTVISLNTSGAAYIGKFLATGGFSYRNISEHDALYNVLNYELEPNMPYHPVDDKSSGWQKQEYLLNAGLSSPVLWNRVAFGLKLDYKTKVGAKQLDPRGENYNLSINLYPSISLRLGRSLLGLSGTYAYGFERGAVSNNNPWQDQKVWEHRGLGESTQTKVGGNEGMKTHSYRSHRYGAALQYSLGDILFVEAGFEHRTTLGTENPKLPKKLGSISENDISLSSAWLFGKDKSNKLSLDALCSLTTGIEYVQQLDKTAYRQEWVVISTNEMTSCTGVNVRLGYDHLFGASDPRGYSWKIGAEATFDLFNQSYLSPASTLGTMRLYSGALADKHFKFRKSTLLVGVHAGYAAGLGAGYNSLNAKAHATPKAMVQDNADYLNASFLKAGGRIEWTFDTGKSLSWFLGGKVSYLRAFALNRDRVICSATFGILF